MDLQIYDKDDLYPKIAEEEIQRYLPEEFDLSFSDTERNMNNMNEKEFLSSSESDGISGISETRGFDVNAINENYQNVSDKIYQVKRRRRTKNHVQINQISGNNVGNVMGGRPVDEQLTNTPGQVKFQNFSPARESCSYTTKPENCIQGFVFPGYRPSYSMQQNGREVHHHPDKTRQTLNNPPRMSRKNDVPRNVSDVNRCFPFPNSNGQFHPCSNSVNDGSYFHTQNGAMQNPQLPNQRIFPYYYNYHVPALPPEATNVGPRPNYGNQYYQHYRNRQFSAGMIPDRRRTFPVNLDYFPPHQTLPVWASTARLPNSQIALRNQQYPQDQFSVPLQQYNFNATREVPPQVNQQIQYDQFQTRTVSERDRMMASQLPTSTNITKQINQEVDECHPPPFEMGGKGEEVSPQVNQQIQYDPFQTRNVNERERMMSSTEYSQLTTPTHLTKQIKQELDECRTLSFELGSNGEEGTPHYNQQTQYDPFHTRTVNERERMMTSTEYSHLATSTNLTNQIKQEVDDCLPLPFEMGGKDEEAEFPMQ